MIIKALTYLKQIGNDFYQDIQINSDFMAQEEDKSSQSNNTTSNSTELDSNHLEGSSSETVNTKLDSNGNENNLLLRYLWHKRCCSVSRIVIII